MKKQFTMKVKLLVAFMAGLLLFSCRKELDFNKPTFTRDFFEVKYLGKEHEMTIKYVLNDLKDFNKQKDFASNVLEHFGVPLWEHSKLENTPKGFSMVSPVANLDDKITGLLVATYFDNKLSVNIISRDIMKKYDIKNPAESYKALIGSLFYRFDKEVFNRGPKPTDMVYKNGKLTTWMKHQIKEVTRMSWVPIYVQNWQDWYMWSDEENRWNYLDTLYSEWLEWQWVEDGSSFSPPPVSVPATAPPGTNSYNTIGGAFGASGAIAGPRPLFEHNDVCSGLSNAWNNFTSNEVFGYITPSGHVLTVGMNPYTGGANNPAPYKWENKYYYAYPVSEQAPSSTVPYFQNGGYYFIEIKSSFHTHTPCRDPGYGTNGVSHPVGIDDRNFARAFPSMTHWAIGCDAVAKYNGETDFFSHIYGSISSTCGSIN